MHSDKIIYTTMTNNGYIDYTENLLKSIKVNNVDINLEVFTTDKKSYEYFSKKTITHDISQNTEYEDFMLQNNDEFGKLMLKKFEMISLALNMKEFVNYIDGDIVIKRNYGEQLLNSIKHDDAFFQNDKRPSKPNWLNLGAGFMFIKSNKETKKFFEPNEKMAKKFLKFKTHDQTYINKYKNKLNYKILPEALFPNGPYYFSNKEKINPMIIHFNYLLGHDKKIKMKDNNEWYI
jgi:hypothetical protein